MGCHYVHCLYLLLPLPIPSPQPGLVASITYRDTDLWSSGFGATKKDVPQATPDKDTLYRIASVSKIFVVSVMHHSVHKHAIYLCKPSRVVNFPFVPIVKAYIPKLMCVYIPYRTRYNYILIIPRFENSLHIFSVGFGGSIYCLCYVQVLMVYHMYDRGLVRSLDDPLNDFCPSFHINNRFTSSSEDITLRQVMTSVSKAIVDKCCQQVIW